MMSGREEQLRNFTTTTIGKTEGLVNPFTVMASPAWRGVEGDIWRGRVAATGEEVIFKHYHPDTEFYCDPARAMSAARLATQAGVAPAVIATDPKNGLIAFEALPENWRCGGLQDVVLPAFREKVIAAKKAFQRGPRIGIGGSVFQEIETLMTRAHTLGLRGHPALETFASVITEAGSRITTLGFDEVASHRDGNTANLMVGPTGEVMLVDFDLSADADPYEDLGCWLIEFFEAEPEARAGFEAWEGRFDEGLFQRAMLYGMADDLRWGLIGSILAATSPRRSLEFAKYASWRFMRLAGMALGSQAADRLRRVA